MLCAVRGGDNGSRCPARARCCGARAATGVDGVEHAEPDLRHDRRLAPVGGRLPGRLGSGLRGHPSHLRRGRRRLAGHVHAPRGELRVQGGAQQRVGRELRPARGPERREHPAERARRARQVLLRPQDALGDRQQELGDRDGAGQLPVRARLPGRLGSELPALVAPGSRRRRDLHVRDDRAARRRLRDEGRDQRELGRELRPERRARRREHPVQRRRGRTPRCCSATSRRRTCSRSP